jgi:hypothetical protein
MLVRFSALAASVLVLLGSAPAFAQQNVGTVNSLTTPVNSVLVLRGGTVLTLAQGDAILQGDQVFTRTNGAVLITFNGCQKALGGQQSIVVDDQFCNTPPLVLAYSALIAGTAVGVGSTVAAAPTLMLTGLVAGSAATFSTSSASGG